jgi:hypothetical protein
MPEKIARVKRQSKKKKKKNNRANVKSKCCGIITFSFANKNKKALPEIRTLL